MEHQMLSLLFPLVLGAFAVGTETMMISGVLPTIARDLSVSPALAGSLVTLFALAYAFGSPVLAVASAGLERKRLLVVSMSAFAVANELASFAPSFAWLAAARVLLALTAGAFVPAAIAYATATQAPERRGRAIALIYAGITLATVVGVPIGTFVASVASWRTTFVGVGVLAVVAALGVAVFLPRHEGIPGIGFAERIAVARRPDVLKLLALTTLVLIGPFGVNTYLGLLAETTLGVSGLSLAGIQMVFGVMSFLGSQFGGYAADRWPRERFIAVLLVVVIIAFALIGVAPRLGGAAGAVALIAGIMLWGLFGWSFPVVQQSRLVSLDPALAPITLSLNTSALYLGAAIGSSLAGAAVGMWSVGAVGLGAALSEVVALAVLFLFSAPELAAPAETRALGRAQHEPAI
jgi:predicted MFS family arabinose efflux permease